MQVTDKLRRNLRLQNTAFVGLLLAAAGLIAWLSVTYSTEFDWTAGNRNTLSEASRKLLEKAEAPITLTAYASDRDQLRKQIRQFAAKYQRAGVAEVNLTFINPNAQPQRVRELGIQRDGQLVVAYQGRTEKVDERSETAVTNAIQRVMRSEARQIRFLTGHGERSPKGRGRNAMARFVQAMEDTGVKVTTLNLAKTPEIPENTATLVIADPQQPLLDAEVATLEAYVANGGNLLWLTDGGPNKALKPLADKLGLTFHQGSVVDPRSRVFGLQDPTQVLVSDYPRHPITRDFGAVTLLPGASGLTADAPKPWQATKILETGKRAWLETGTIRDRVQFDKAEGDREGPLTLGVALERSTKDDGQSESGKPNRRPGPAKPGDSDQEPGQRVLVTTDSDFLSNAFLGSGGNRDLGLNMVHWLTADQTFINVTPASAPGTSLNLPTPVAWAIPILFLGGIPLALIVTGTVIWIRRRQL